MSSGNTDNRQMIPMMGMNLNAEINQKNQMNSMFSNIGMTHPSGTLKFLINNIANMQMNMPMNIPMNMMFNQMMMQGQMNPMNAMNALNPMMPSPLLNKPVTGEYRKVWVGHIPPILSDTFILKLLESCGSVASWKRTTDHMGRPKGFGLCEYHTVESMLKSLRLLNHLKLEEGYELSVRIYIINNFR